MKHRNNPLRHEVEFRTDDGLHIEIKTDRLTIRSIQPDDAQNCIKLMGDPIVMQKFSTGVPYDEKTVRSRLETWQKRWDNHDPFSVYAIFKKDTQEFIGIIAIGHSTPGESETSYIFHEKFWGKGYGSETADAIFQSLIPKLMLRGYELEHKPLKKLVATARLDNPSSAGILVGAGFVPEAKIFKFGAERHFFGLFAKTLRNDYQNFFRRQDLALHKARQSLIKDLGVEVTEEAMAESSFGQFSNTAKKKF